MAGEELADFLRVTEIRIGKHDDSLCPLCKSNRTALGLCLLPPYFENIDAGPERVENSPVVIVGNMTEGAYDLLERDSAYALIRLG